MSAKSSFLHSISPCSVWVHQSTSLLHPLDGFPLQFFDTCFISQAREAPVTWQALSSFSKNSTFWRSLSRHHRQISVHSAIMLSSFAAMPNDGIVSLYLSLDRFPGEQRPYFFIFTFPNIRCNTWLPAGSQTLTGWMNKQSHAISHQTWLSFYPISFSSFQRNASNTQALFSKHRLGRSATCTLTKIKFQSHSFQINFAWQLGFRK